jgi:hypothetical protein
VHTVAGDSSNLDDHSNQPDYRAESLAAFNSMTNWLLQPILELL